MSAHTKTHRTDKTIKKPVEEKSIPWREALKDHIEKYTEPGVLLRGSRYKLELTQQEVSEALGVSQHHISEMENGKRSIGKEMAKRLAEFFKTDYRLFL